MFLFLSKLLPLLVYPVGLATILLIGALIAHRHARIRNTLIVLALLAIWLGGNRLVAMGLAGWIEGLVPPLPALNSMQAGSVQADAIVVLGGATRPSDPPRPTSELNEAGDRLLYAKRL